MTDLSIIIVNWNIKQALKDCLESIRKNVCGISYEIIIVDNNSSDGSVEMIQEEYPTVILIKNNQNIGYGRANNQGIRKAKGKYVLILNPDTIVLPGSIEKMYGLLEEKPEVGACGPLVLDSNYQRSHPVIYDPTIWELFGKDTFLRKMLPKLCSPLYPQPTERRKVERLSGCCFLARKSALLAVGLFDEKIFLFYDEADLFFRLRKKGWVIYYLPELSMVHLHGKSMSLFSPFYKELFIRKSSLIYFRNRYGLIPSILFRSFLILSYLLYAVILEILSFFWHKDTYQKKRLFYKKLLKATARSLFRLN